jgi:lipooligosaccharide transport system ATP-binding protein
MENIIEVENLYKRFGAVTAVDGVSFSVAKGEFFGLLGPNGAGKTSTIRMLYGFSPPTSGSIRVFDIDIVEGWRTIKSRVGVCHQENTLDPDLTVVQNLLVFASYFSIPAAAARSRAAELLDFFALSHKKNAKVAELSGGMARRLILARALINHPEMLVLDEPTTGLDPQSRHQLWDKLEALKKSGLTVVITTHYMEEAAQLCDRLVIVDHGKILVDGSPEALIAAHAGRHVIEVEGPEERLRSFIAEKKVAHDDLGDRVILYTPEDATLNDTIRDQFCMNRCTFRNGTLEDVFLRLTGRELRE